MKNKYHVKLTSVLNVVKELQDMFKGWIELSNLHDNCN